MPAAPDVAVAMCAAPHALAICMATEPVPPDPAVMTTVRLAFFHGLPGGGIGPPGSEAVRFSENNEVSPTSGSVPASAWLIDAGLRLSMSSGTTT